MTDNPRRDPPDDERAKLLPQVVEHTSDYGGLHR